MQVGMYFVFWFAMFSIIFEGIVSEDSWMQLEYISTPNKCLTAPSSWYNSIRIDTCNTNIENNKNQLWRWDENGHLQNNKTGTCIYQPLVESPVQPLAILGHCDIFKERLTCLPYALKTRTGSYLAARDDGNIGYSLQFLYNDEKGKWRRFNDPATNICNYTAQVWRTLDVAPSKKIETGLSFLFVGIDEMYPNTSRLFVYGQGKRKVVLPVNIYLRWTSVSVGPTGIWLLAEPKNPVVQWINSTNAKDSIISPQEIDGLDSIKDIDVGPTGLVFIVNGSHICSRIGINDTQPEGSDWNCTAGNAELLSCGIDGCFFVNGVKITYQPDNKTRKIQQFFTPFQNRIQDIDAGLNYELWVVTDSHDVYRRSGTSARLPWGSNWELVPGIQLNTISIGIFGPVGILASGGSGQAVILNGVPTPERQQELDRICIANCSKKPCLARFRWIRGETSELRCYWGSSRSGDTQYPGLAASAFDAPEFKRTLFKRPLLGRNETQMWLDHLCNDPSVNPVEALRPSAVNYFAEFDGHNLTCRNLLDEAASNIDEKLKGLTKSSCARVPLGISSGMFSSIGFSSLYSRNGQPRFQNDNPGWCFNRTDDHLEIDFFFLHEICALKLGGNNQIDRWILRYSLDGSDWWEYIQQLKGKYEETQILPVYIMARYLRFEPVIESNKPLNCCLQFEVYGSSQAFKADSCSYYGKQLQATNDGIYIIYPSQGTERQIVYCTGLRSKDYSDVYQFQITSPDLKLPLHLKRTSSVWDRSCFNCRDVSGKFSGIRMLLDETASLGDFRGTCISDPETCLNGLSFELWLDFVDFNLSDSTTTRNIILNSGSKAFRGFQLLVTHTEIILRVYTTNHISECQVPIPHFNHRVHIVGSWDKKTMIAQLFVDKVKQACVDIWARNTSQTDDWHMGELKFRPIAKIGEGFVVAQNLSIWMRRITDQERQELFKYLTPNVSIVWSSWSACIDCKQYRNLECGNDACDVDIFEFQPCYDIRKCGLRMNWPLDDKTSKPCSTCRHLVASSALILPTRSTVNLGSKMCAAGLQRCVNGLTIELWIWFAEYDHCNVAESECTILQSGFKSGFRLTVKGNGVTFTLLDGVTFPQCTSVVHFNRWNHVVIRWVKELYTINFYVENITRNCTYSRNSRYGGNSDDGKLVLGPVANVGQGYVVAQNLSVWMQASNDDEFHHLLQQKSPKLPGPWSNWTKCSWPCKQMRYRNCPECDVNITETRLCYHVHECGLRIGWSLQDLSNLTWEGGCSTCRDLVASSALVLPMNSTASLGNFTGKCVSELRRCVNGLTFEAWLWFAEYDWTENEILQSGDGWSGFQFLTAGGRFILKFYTYTFTYKCTAAVQYNLWNHVVGLWNKELNISTLTVNHVLFGSCDRRRRGVNEEIPGMVSDGRLLLGPILKVGYGYVVTQNLSIWMRALSEAEIHFLLKQRIPEIPANWNEWSKCLKPNCTRNRERKCQSTRCTVNIRERKDCRSCPAPASNCDEIPQEGDKSLSNGIYSIYLRPHFNKTVKVFCEQTLLEGGWLVILNRKNGSLNFDRGWDDYKVGFGDLKAEHWLGNENLYQLTKEDSFKLIIYFSDNNNTIISETTCDFFRVASESKRYAWNFKLCEGPASHALSYSNGAMFSTSDNDNDLNAAGSCAKQYSGGFWYKNCSKVRFTSRGEFVSFSTENGSWVNMFAVTMMIKPYKKRYVEMNVVIRFVDEKWSKELASNATHSFFLLAGKIKHNIQEVYRSDDRYISATVKSFSQGSVIANIIIAYLNITGRQVTTLKRQLDHGYLNGIMAVSYNYSDFRIINSSVPIGWPHINELYNTSSTSFNVSWSYTKNMSFVEGFRIYFKSRKSTQWKTVYVSKHVFQTEVTDLKEFTMYEVLVSAYSLEGDGLPSPVRNVTTDEWVPEMGPPNLTGYWNKTNFAVHVTWSQIPQRFINGYLTHYVITYSNNTHSVEETTRTNSSVLTGLPIFSQYTIDVVGATRIGVGLKSSNITYRTRGIPLPAPTNLTATNMTGPAINVSWTPIPDHPNFDKVVGYRIYYYYLSDWKNVTIPANKTHVIIHPVKWNVHYDITVAGLTVNNQEGQHASTSTFLKNITAPEWPPVNLSCRGVSPYSIVVGWYGFTVVDTGGSLKGYRLSYNVRSDPEKIMNVTLDSFQPWYNLENLHTLTEYEIRVLVYNEEGFSPLAKIICKTSIGVPDPDATPQNLQAHSYVSDTSITLSWPHVFMNGTRRGYSVHYRKVSDAGSEIKDSRIEAMTFSENTTEAIIPGLDVYSKYCFQLFALNENFPSKPSNSVCAETCRCPPTFYTNWFIQDPYVVTSSSGIFPPLVKRMIAGVCGPCKEYNDTVVVDFKMDGNGETAKKNTSKIVQLVKTIDATQVSFPVVGPETGLAGRRGAFIPIINSPMSAFITRKPVVHTKAQYVIQETIVNTLPLLAFTFVLLLLSAMFIWAAEYKSKEETFPKPFHKGVQQGLWWAFVSVTTVGYGDKIPTSKAGRLFSVIWILYGTVFFGLITASLSTALHITFIVVSTDVNLYNSHVAAIDHSLEVQLGLHIGAHVNEGRNFSDVDSILKAVENGDVDGALIDKLTAARLANLSDPNSNLMVKNVIPKPSTYGIFLAGNAIKLRKKFRQFLQNNADFVTEQIQSYTEPLKEEVSSQKEEDAERKENTSQANILSGSSPIFLPLLLWLLAVLIFVFAVGLVWHFIYYKHVAKAAEKNQVCAVNETQTGALSLQQFVKDFHTEAYAKLRDMKSRHIAEFKALRKLKTR